MCHKDEANVGSEWKEDSAATACPLCAKEFSLGRRRHHCRHCGGIFCAKCSDNQMNLPSSAKPVRYAAKMNNDKLYIRNVTFAESVTIATLLSWADNLQRFPSHRVHRGSKYKVIKETTPNRYLLNQSLIDSKIYNDDEYLYRLLVLL